MFGLSFTHILIIGAVAVMVFGERLPEVLRTAGRHFAEFKKHLRSIEDVIHSTTSDISKPASSHASRRSDYDTEDREEATAPRFEPPTAAEPPAGPSASESRSTTP